MGKCNNRIFNKIKINMQIKMEILNKMKINNMMTICKMDKNNNKMITQVNK